LVDDDRKWVPLHFACWLGAPVQVLQLLLDRDPEALFLLPTPWSVQAQRRLFGQHSTIGHARSQYGPPCEY
jgi:hypothetical protein